MKDANTKYSKEKSTEIMKLNNDTTQLNSVYEGIIEEQISLKSEAAEISSKKLAKISELAQILMAIDNTENICFERKCTNRAVKHTFPDPKPPNHNELDKSVVYAVK